MRNSPRPFIASLHRRPKYKHHSVVLWSRHYSSIENAIKRAVAIALFEGQPGDVVEFAHADLGIQIGTVRLHVRGRITIDWTPLDDEIRKADYEIRGHSRALNRMRRTKGD